MTVPYIYLESQVRGDEFDYTGTIGNEWLSTMFTGGVKFTLRSSMPATSVTTDTAAVDQATDTAGDLTFPTTSTIRVLIPGARTTLWPAPKRLFFDCQGIVTTGARVLTLCRGEVLIVPDVTRAQ